MKNLFSFPALTFLLICMLTSCQLDNPGPAVHVSEVTTQTAGQALEGKPLEMYIGLSRQLMNAQAKIDTLEQELEQCQGKALSSRDKKVPAEFELSPNTTSR